RQGRACGDLESAFRGLASRAAGLLELGDRDGVESVERACRRFLRDHPFPYAGVVTRSMEIMLALLDGRWADARTAIEAAERDLRASASAGFALLVAVQRMFLAIDQGEVGSLGPAADRLVERFGRIPALAAFVGTVRAQSGDLASGRAALAAFLD